MNTHLSSSIGLTGLSYRLPAQSTQLGSPTSNGIGGLTTSVETLKTFGFETMWISRDPEELYSLMLSSAREALAQRNVRPDELEALILYSGVPAERSAQAQDDLAVFDYVLPRLAHDLAAQQCKTYALSQLGCSGTISMIELARNILQTSKSRYVLCIAGDRLPTTHTREIIYNIVSDAACAFLVERDSSHNTVLALQQRSNNALWNTSHMEEQILATYFPMAARSIHEALSSNGLSADDIVWFVPHNVSIRSWELLSRIVPLPLERVWLSNVRRIGHTVSSDHIINVRDMQDAGILKKDDLIFCFTFGFGAHWSSIIIRH